MFSKNLKILILIHCILYINFAIANSRVSFSRPGNMMRTPNYAYNHENPHFFSLSVSSEIVNFSSRDNLLFLIKSNATIEVIILVIEAG